MTEMTQPDFDRLVESYAENNPEVVAILRAIMVDIHSKMATLQKMNTCWAMRVLDLEECVGIDPWRNKTIH